MWRWVCAFLMGDAVLLAVAACVLMSRSRNRP